MGGELRGATVGGEDEVGAGRARLVAPLDAQRNLFGRRLPDRRRQIDGRAFQLLSNVQASAPEASTLTFIDQSRLPDTRSRYALAYSRRNGTSPNVPVPVTRVWPPIVVTESLAASAENFGGDVAGANVLLGERELAVELA